MGRAEVSGNLSMRGPPQAREALRVHLEHAGRDGAEVRYLWRLFNKLKIIHKGTHIPHLPLYSVHVFIDCWAKVTF